MGLWFLVSGTRSEGVLGVTGDCAVEFSEEGEYKLCDDAGEELEDSAAVVWLDDCSAIGTAY